MPIINWIENRMGSDWYTTTYTNIQQLFYLKLKTTSANTWSELSSKNLVILT